MQRFRFVECIHRRRKGVEIPKVLAGDLVSVKVANRAVGIAGERRIKQNSMESSETFWLKRFVC